MTANRAKIGLIIAVVAWAVATIWEITLGTPIPRATLVFSGATLLTIVSLLPPITGVWVKRINFAFGVASAIVAGAYAYNPHVAADIMRYQIDVAPAEAPAEAMPVDLPEASADAWDAHPQDVSDPGAADVGTPPDVAPLDAGAE